MYKSRLQEYCQAKSWTLPEYSTTKEGLDHCPRFKATVIVNGTTYFIPDFCKSSKEAQNLVAKVAFDYLTGLSRASSTSQFPTSSNSLQQPETNETVQATSMNRLDFPRDEKKVKEMTHLYKHQLQVYAQKRNLDLPVYVSEHQGPPHACRFRSKVTVEGKTYESQEYFSTVKDSENAAAKIAIMSVSPDGIEEEDPGFFKNLLQDLAQKNYSCLPEYHTSRSGPPHSPIFISTVEIKEESFRGQEAKTKKLAEMYAAKVAYTALTKRKSEPNGDTDSIGTHVDDTRQCSSPKFQSFDGVALLQRNIPAPSLRSDEVSREQARCNKGVNQKGSESKHIVVEPEGLPKADPNNCAQKVEGVAFGLELSPGAPQSPSRSGLREIDESWDSPDAPSSKKKVKVYPRVQNMTLPPGAIIMHQDEKWIAVTMDSIHGNA